MNFLSSAEKQHTNSLKTSPGHTSRGGGGGAEAFTAGRLTCQLELCERGAADGLEGALGLRGNTEGEQIHKHFTLNNKLCNYNAIR